MAKLKQGLVIRTYAKNQNAKYKLKYSYSISQIINAQQIINKYTYSKLITPSTKKYSYN